MEYKLSSLLVSLLVFCEVLDAKILIKLPSDSNLVSRASYLLLALSKLTAINDPLALNSILRIGVLHSFGSWIVNYSSREGVTKLYSNLPKAFLVIFESKIFYSSCYKSYY